MINSTQQLQEFKYANPSITHQSHAKIHVKRKPISKLIKRKFNADEAKEFEEAFLALTAIVNEQFKSLKKDEQTVPTPLAHPVISSKVYSLDIIPESPVSVESDGLIDKKFKEETAINFGTSKIW